jgi:hypothetical protein
MNVRNCVNHMLGNLLLFNFCQLNILVELLGRLLINRIVFAKIQFALHRSRDASRQGRRSHSVYRLIGLRGPLRVRALVRVRCPRSGSPRRCLIPR